MRNCYSGNRCNRRCCPTCRWRYAGRLARRILGRSQGHLYTIEIDAKLHTLPDFWAWRVEARNLVDHRRRTCRWWRDLGLSVGLGNNGRVRGVVSLGAVTVEEFEMAVGRRWRVALRPIDPATLREEVYAAIRPSMIADFGWDRGRYQSLKFYIGPSRGSVRKLPEVTATRASYWSEPMPILC